MEPKACYKKQDKEKRSKGNARTVMEALPGSATEPRVHIIVLVRSAAAAFEAWPVAEATFQASGLGDSKA